MSDPSPTPSISPAPSPRVDIRALIHVAAFGSAYWVNFVWFYLDDRWGTTPAGNLLINAGFGFLYMIGCLVTARASYRFTARGMMLLGFVLLIVLTLGSLRVDSSHAMAAVILAHAFIVALTWPNLEMLAVRGSHGEAMSRAIGHYNIAWALMSAVSYAVMGWLFRLHPLTFFLIPCVCWALALVLIFRNVPAFGKADEVVPVPRPSAGEATPAVSPRRAAAFLKLSRSGIFVGYVLIAALLPIMPAVVIDRLGFELRPATFFGSIWVFSRVASFVVLTGWHGWHYRPAFVLGALASLPILFIVILLAPWTPVVALGQVLLGLAIGFVYTCSLFYSLHAEAATTQAAYHEAFIGAGYTVGPLVAAAAGATAERLGAPQLETIAVILFVLLAMFVWILYLNWRRDSRET